MATVITINDSKVVHETVEDEVIIINLENGNYYSLVDVGAEIWQALADEPTEEQIVSWLARRYDTPPETISPSMTQLLADLLDEEIIAHREIVSTSPGIEDNEVVQTPFVAPVLTKFTNMTDLLLLDPIHDVDDQGWPIQKTP